MPKTPWMSLVALVFLAGFAAIRPAFADAADLVNLLTRDLGVTKEQAAGGSGAMFAHAKQQMSPADFSQLSSAIPGLDGLLAAAPATQPQAEAPSNMLDKASSMVGGGGAGGLSQLAGSFAKLGLSPDMVSKFAPIVLDYVNSAGGSELMASLKSAMM